MTLKEQIDQDIKDAMRQKKKEELTALRSIKSMILLAETEKGSGGTLSEDAELKLLTKAAKQRRESADIYIRENRPELAEKEEFEFEVISRYLPKQLSSEELSKALDSIISSSGAAGPQDMGKVMGMATKQLAGKADGKAIADLVKQKLTQH
ncbi:GatB/YqeY domain-containing protein [Fulvivirga sedimenti]|uniref:GatB/YqeY domain-containing protein n=1 Tax=Fulvivirga sedimenti TaxID=2879465 RepID=A0A9X1HLZ9_9BACT|nr:GatB/YqeY domain-containing protein [Fulvivirga sedimenti]MCA6074430.1 GatB/YqeY domain-containing protein [Fulvivirga sedimenti]